jgi:hypothetical protein
MWDADDDKKKKNNNKIYIARVISILIICREVATLSVQKLTVK